MLIYLHRVKYLHKYIGVKIKITILPFKDKDPKYCNGRFHTASSWIADGECDDSMNNEENCWDGGDCDQP